VGEDNELLSDYCEIFTGVLFLQYFSKIKCIKKFTFTVFITRKSTHSLEIHDINIAFRDQTLNSTMDSKNVQGFQGITCHGEAKSR
jgi:hypothetical protein